MNQSRVSSPKSTKIEDSDAWVFSAEATFAGVVLGSILGLLITGSHLALMGLYYIPVLIEEGRGKMDFVGVAIIGSLLLLGVVVLTLVLGCGMGALVGGFVAAVGCLLTFFLLSRWMELAFWPVVARAHHRGMLTGTVLGVALQPLLWWRGWPLDSSNSLTPLGKIFFHLPNAGLLMAIPITIFLPIAAAIFSVYALFHLRAGHPEGPWRPLPFPFKEW